MQANNAVRLSISLTFVFVFVFVLDLVWVFEAVLVAVGGAVVRRAVVVACASVGAGAISATRARATIKASSAPSRRAAAG